MTAVDQKLSERIAQIKGAQVIKSFCYTCPWQCPTEVYVRDGRIVYHKGNEEAPNNIGTRCAKGMASWWVTEDPDRLKHPLLRTSKKGDTPEFKQISWDEAFEFIATKLKAIRKKYGPEAVAYMTHHDPNSGFMTALLCDLYGTPNVSVGHAMGCEGDRRHACLTTFGHIFPMHDFGPSKYIMLWGMNNLGANQGLSESRALLQAKKNGAKLVVIDPAFTETAQKADEWIAIKPGTDAALALAMAHEIISGELQDKQFVKKYCEGFTGFRTHLTKKGYTPRWAESITGIAADTIVRLAREFATTKPALAAMFKGAGYYSNGNDGSRAIFLLDAITGQVDNPGNIHLKDWAPLAPPVVIPAEAKTAPSKPPLAHAMGYALAPLTGYPIFPEIPNTRLPEAVLEDKPYAIRGIFFHATNPVMTDPNRDRMQQMFPKLDLAVAMELYMSETAQECDIVLPETSFHEHAEIRQGMWMGAEAILCQPVVGRVGEAKPTYEIAQGIAQKMGWGKHFAFKTWEDWARPVVAGLPLSLEELKTAGFWADTIKYQRYKKGLPTKSGKVEIYSNAYADAGLNPYPEWREPAVAPDKQYPLRLTHAKLSMHCNALTQNNPYLMEICGENWVEINSRDALAYGISNNQDVWLESPKDKIRIKAKVVEGLVPGCVSVRHGHGFGHWATGSIAKGRGAHSNNLMESHNNPVTGTNSYNECKVRVMPA